LTNVLYFGIRFEELRDSLASWSLARFDFSPFRSFAIWFGGDFVTMALCSSHRDGGESLVLLRENGNRNLILHTSTWFPLPNSVRP
jgi:hypothetical protein